MSFLINFGRRNGGFYVHPGHNSFRVCFWFVAFTVFYFDLDNFFRDWNLKEENQKNQSEAPMGKSQITWHYTNPPLGFRLLILNYSDEIIEVSGEYWGRDPMFIGFDGTAFGLRDIAAWAYRPESKLTLEMYE
ncbi:MAG: hypothetical protein ABEI54_02210 [Candidatus Bipolaricaulia bacterium]